MGNTYYVDTAGSNTAPYDTWVKAAPALATVVAIPPAAGDTIYARGTQNIASEIDLASSGTNAAGFIKLIGCNALGNVDGTRLIIDAGGGNLNCIDLVGQDMWWFENIEVQNTATTYSGFYTSATGVYGCIWINCCAHGVAHGWQNNNVNDSIWFRCVSYSNRYTGWYRGANPQFYFCCARDNTGHGFDCYGNLMQYVGCIAYSNGDDGFGGMTSQTRIINCVVDANTDNGMEITAHTVTNFPVVIGCRITNHSGAGDIGINANSETLVTAYNYFEDNDGDNIQNATLHYAIPIVGGSTTSNVEDQADTNEGYVGGGDYSTGYTSGTDPHLRRTAITIPTS